MLSPMLVGLVGGGYLKPQDDGCTKIILFFLFVVFFKNFISYWVFKAPLNSYHLYFDGKLFKKNFLAIAIFLKFLTGTLAYQPSCRPVGVTEKGIIANFRHISMNKNKSQRKTPKNKEIITIGES